MYEALVCGYTLPEAYHDALKVLSASTNDEISITMKVTDPLAEPRISRCFPGGPADLERYVQEMVHGVMDFEVDTGNWKYTYHKRIAQWINFVIYELKRDPNSRRAAISVRDNRLDAFSEDPACLQNIQFMIREGKLNMYVLFRSNDAVRATFMNAYALIEIQKYIADNLGVPVGEYIHRANSFHVYPESKATLEGYLKRIYSDEESTFNYEGDWDELMEEAKPAIAQMIEEQKKKHGK